MRTTRPVAPKVRHAAWLAVSLLVASLLVLVSPAPAGAIGVAADTGAVVTTEQWIVADRVLDLTIQSPSTDNATRKVRLILPAGWSKTSEKTWPSLYLLHGGVDSYTAWDSKSALRTLSQGEDAIMVMPDTSWCSAYSNWWNRGNYGRPQWETWITTEVRQILERNYRANETRGVVGNSMGGLGALKFAANHNPMFKVAASFSGDIDTLKTWPGGTGVSTPGLGCNPFGDYWKNVWGDPAIPEQRAMWEANNPYHQAHKLAGVKLFLGAGTASGDAHFYSATKHVENRLNELEIPVTTNYITGGGHDWTQWTTQLNTAWPMLMDALEEPEEPTNTAPVADAGDDQVVGSGAAVTLDGSGSSDADDDELTYEWVQQDGPEVDLAGADSAAPSFTAPTGPATLTFELRVSDGVDEATDSVTVTVEAPPSLVNVTGAVTAGADVSGVVVFAVLADGVWPSAIVPVTATGPGEGTYAFEALADGEYQFVVAAPSSSSLLSRWVGGNRDRALAETYSVVGGEVLDLPETGLQRGARFSGLVTDGNGTGLAGVVVRAWGPTDVWLPSVETTTDAAGAYLTPAVVDGSYRLSFQPASGSGYAAQWNDGALTRQAAPDVVVGGIVDAAVVDAELAGTGSISGVVTLGGGAPAAGALVMAYTPTDTWVGTHWATTGADGSYQFADLPLGTYQVRFAVAAGSGLVPEWYQHTNVRSAATTLVVTAGAQHTGIDGVLATS